MAYRSGAKENDLICVSGNLGAAFAGLQLLEREKRVYDNNPNMQPDLSGHDYILERQLKPEARKDIFERLQEAKIVPNSMIDLSDGLSSDVMHICEESKVGCQIYKAAITALYFDWLVSKNKCFSIEIRKETNCYTFNKKSF